MDYVIEQMDGMQVIGFEKAITYENSYGMVPKFWNEVYSVIGRSGEGHKGANEIQEVVLACNIGEYGIVIEGEKGSKHFTYLIAGKYDGREVPEGLVVHDIPAALWAKFRCVGPLPGSLQTINTRIFREWLPGNPDYELSMESNLEWYSKGDLKSADYLSEIWIPVKKK